MVMPGSETNDHMIGSRLLSSGVIKSQFGPVVRGCSGSPGVLPPRQPLYTLACYCLSTGLALLPDFDGKIGVCGTQHLHTQASRPCTRMADEADTTNTPQTAGTSTFHAAGAGNSLHGRLVVVFPVLSALDQYWYTLLYVVKALPGEVPYSASADRHDKWGADLSLPNRR